MIFKDDLFEKILELSDMLKLAETKLLPITFDLLLVEHHSNQS